jgi:hypothetical protein
MNNNKLFNVESRQENLLYPLHVSWIYPTNDFFFTSPGAFGSSFLSIQMNAHQKTAE